MGICVCCYMIKPCIGQVQCRLVLLEIVRDSPYVMENMIRISHHPSASHTHSQNPPDTFDPSSSIEQRRVSCRHSNTHTHTHALTQTHTRAPSAQLRDVTCTHHEIQSTQRAREQLVLHITSYQTHEGGLFQCSCFHQTSQRNHYTDRKPAAIRKCFLLKYYLFGHLFYSSLFLFYSVVCPFSKTSLARNSAGDQCWRSCQQYCFMLIFHLNSSDCHFLLLPAKISSLVFTCHG